MKIAIIGTGNLGKSIAKGLITNNAITSLYLTKRNLDGIADFNGYKNVYLTTDNLEAVKNSDILLFAVQPAHFEEILDQIKPLLTENHVLISTITGFSISKIETKIGTENFIIRAMPNTAIAVGKSMTCLCANLQGEQRIGIASRRRTKRNFQKEAQELAMYTSEGAANLLLTNGKHPEEEIDCVTTPQGCTIQGLNEMENNGLSAALIQGMVASFNKINTIKKEQL